MSGLVDAVLDVDAALGEAGIAHAFGVPWPLRGPMVHPRLARLRALATGDGPTS